LTVHKKIQYDRTLLKKICFQILLKDLDKQGETAALHLDTSVKGKNCEIGKLLNRTEANN